MSMKSLFCSFYLLSLNCFLLAQDTAWKKCIIDENLTVLLPGPPMVTDTFMIKDQEKMKFRLLNANTQVSSIIISITSGSKISIDNTESMQEVYKGIAEGIQESAAKSGLKYKIADTTINNILCKRTQLYGATSATKATASSLLFLLNSRVYNITVVAHDGETPQSKLDLNHLLGSMRVTATLIKEKQFASKEEAMGYKLGYLLGHVVVPVIFIALLIATVLIVRIKRKKSEKTYNK